MPHPLQIVRRSAWRVVEGFVMPTLLFYAASMLWSVWWGIVAGVLWGWGAMGVRMLLKSRVPGVLVYSALGMTLRLVVAFMLGSAALYFIQPQVTTFLTGVAFLVSAVVGGGLIQRMAGDFCPFPEGFTEEGWVQKTFLHVSLVWGVGSMLNAGMSVAVLFALPVGAFPVVKAGITLLCTGGALMLSVMLFCRRARGEGVHVVWERQELPS